MPPLPRLVTNEHDINGFQSGELLAPQTHELPRFISCLRGESLAAVRALPRKAALFVTTPKICDVALRRAGGVGRSCLSLPCAAHRCPETAALPRPRGAGEGHRRTSIGSRLRCIRRAFRR